MKKILTTLTLALVIFGFTITTTTSFAKVEKNGTVKVSKKKAKKTAIKKTNRMIRMDNGLVIEVLKEGAGEAVTSGKAVSVHYTGTFKDGTMFDSSKTRNVPFQFALGAGMVIKGWDLGVVGMKVGEIRKLSVPYALAYGEAGYPGAIPPKSDLYFEVELLGFK